MPADDLLQSGATILGIGGITFATFVVVSFTEMRKKIDEQVARGEEPYQLQVDNKPPRPQPQQRKQDSKKQRRKPSKSRKK